MQKIGTLSKPDYAKSKGIDRNAVNALIRQGRLVLTTDGLVDVAASEARLKATLKRPAMQAYHAGNRAAAKANGEETVKPEAGDSTYTALAKSRAQSEAHKAALLKMDLDERNGVICRADDVKRAAVKAAREARSAILNVPARLGPILAAESDPARCIAMLEAELRAVCASIAGE